MLNSEVTPSFEVMCAVMPHCTVWSPCITLYRVVTLRYIVPYGHPALHCTVWSPCVTLHRVVTLRYIVPCGHPALHYTVWSLCVTFKGNTLPVVIPS